MNSTMNKERRKVRGRHASSVHVTPKIKSARLIQKECEQSKELLIGKILKLTGLVRGDVEPAILKLSQLLKNYEGSNKAESMATILCCLREARRFEAVLKDITELHLQVARTYLNQLLTAKPTKSGKQTISIGTIRFISTLIKKPNMDSE